MQAWRFLAGGLAAGCAGLLYAAAFLFLRATRWLKPRQAAGRPDHLLRVLLVGRVDSQNWCRAHLDPIAWSPKVGQVLALIDGPVTAHAKVTLIRVPAPLAKLLRRQLARCVWAGWCAFRLKPDVIIGYSFFPNALLAVLLARVTGAAAIYNVTGGPLEITSGGGFVPDRGGLRVARAMTRALSRLAARVVADFDAVIVRGEQARTFIRGIAPRVRVEIIAGGVDESRFPALDGPRAHDLTFLGRIVGVKQPLHVVEVAARVLARRPGSEIMIAGSGPLLPEVIAAAGRLGISGQVKFPGHVERIGELLSQTRIFILTSRSEGLSIALAEAMIAGAVPVVADVGDLGELVRNGETGWLIPPGDFDAYASRICQILEDQVMWERLSKNARQAALANNSLKNITDRWSGCFGALAEPEAGTELKPAGVTRT